MTHRSLLARIVVPSKSTLQKNWARIGLRQPFNRLTIWVCIFYVTSSFLAESVRVRSFCIPWKVFFQLTGNLVFVPNFVTAAYIFLLALSIELLIG